MPSPVATTAEMDTESQIKYVREKFQEVYAENIQNNLYSEIDLKRFEDDDIFVQTYIRGAHRLDEGVELVHESFKWRNELKVHDLCDASFPRWMHEVGGGYFHNVDKDGHRLFMVKVRLHKKDPQTLPEIKKFLVWRLETAFQEDPQSQVVVFFDMTNTGLANLDMELIRFIITCFKFYYPTFLAYLLIYEMPWIFNAAWKVVKTWLSAEAVSKLKFVSKTDVQGYINRDQLPDYMGGTDTYEYKYIPPEEAFSDSTDDQASALRKRVTFADQDNSVYRSFSRDSIAEDLSPTLTSKTSMPMVSYANNNSNTTSAASTNGLAGSKSARLARKHTRDENSFIGRLLTISPAEELKFSTDDGAKEPYDIISLTNTLPYSIAFKVKTTSPEKYRVRPSSGLVNAGSCAEVFVYLQPGFHNTVHKDKFLVMAMEMTDESAENIAELWRTAPKENIMEHRLRCINISRTRSEMMPEKSSTESDQDFPVAVLQGLQTANRQLASQVKLLIVSHAVLAVLVAFLIFYLLFWRPISDGAYCSKSNA